ncbi:rRNA-binding ribosome biosynthesis protein rpf2 [Dinochytrium kinnereticum]|nr:rRNA-binding ribosome biosynthesis protein rpf2 [Dinochytrium kinnereticum]
MSTADPRASVGGRLHAGSLSSQRRSSAYVGRPSSIGVSSLGALGITKDPRPIREKTWQSNAVRSLINFLVQAGYNQAVSAKTLQAPSAKDFQSIFKFLYSQLDPKYIFQKKFEEEVPVILRGLRFVTGGESLLTLPSRYPFCDQISKSHLHSVGSPHAWPSLLAMLTWMVELILCCDQIDNQNEFDDQPNAEIAAEKVFFEYLTKAYAVFLAGDDNYDSMDRELISNFDRKNEKIVAEVGKLNNEHEILSREWSNLRDSESPLTVAEKENQTLHSDIEKFKQYILHLESKKEKLIEQVKALDEDLSVKEAELAKISSEKADLQRTVDMQEISPADVDRMTAEREQLVRSLESLAAKTDECQRTIWEKEITLQKKIDQLEKHTQEYNTLAYQLGLEKSNLSPADIQFSIDFNAASIDPGNDLSDRLRTRVKPSLVTLRADYNSSLHVSQDELIALQETLDSLTESISEKNDELQVIESRISKLTSQYNDERNIAMENNSITSSELESLEREIQRMKIELATTLTASQQKVQKAAMDYEQFARKNQDFRSSVINGVFKTFEDTLAFREHIADSLNDLQQLALAELEISKNPTKLNFMRIRRPEQPTIPNERGYQQEPKAIIFRDSPGAIPHFDFTEEPLSFGLGDVTEFGLVNLPHLESESRWKTIVHGLSLGFTSAEDVASVISSYNPRKNASKRFNGLTHYLLELAPNTRYMFDHLLPAMAKLALRLPELFPKFLPQMPSGGAVQEEILFIINPELIATRLFAEELQDNESLLIVGAERFSSYKGYGSTFEWDGPYEDRAERMGDGVYYGNSTKLMLDSFTLRFRVLTKQRHLQQGIGVGCGAFNGDPELKFLIQVIASSVVGKGLKYFTFGDSQFAFESELLHKHLRSKGVTAGKLAKVIFSYLQEDQRLSVFEFVQQAIDPQIKPKTATGKRVLKKREPQVHEGAKPALFLKGTTTSELGLDALKDLYQLKRPDAILFTKKNDIHPFDDPRPAEFFSQKNDSSFMVLANHSKKRPHNLVMVRFFDHQVLDMIEFGITRGLPAMAFDGEKPTVGHRPVLLFQGHLFEVDDTFKAVKNMFLDFFRGEEVDRINLKGLDRVISISVDSSKMVHIRCYTVALLKGEGTLPKVKLNECGPSLEMELRRTRIAEESLLNEALRVPKELKPKTVKNIERDATGDTVGRIHMHKQDFSKLQTRKMKGLKRSKTAGDDEASESSPQSKKTKRTAE